MAASQMSDVIQHLRRAVILQDGAGLTDGQLLESFIHRREESALGALVRRHGPMVWGVCRRVVRNHHDAEDAFQATFLVLVRKAATIMPRGQVGNWLYGVAHQTALKARAMAAKRRVRERQAIDMPEPELAPRDVWDDLQGLLDQELSRLPDKFRGPVVLCDLEGKTRKEAARQLGIPEGTVAGWLARGRVMLAKRLARHGLTVSGGALAGVLAQNVATAKAPASSVSAAIKAASLFAAGHTAAKGMISVKAVTLTEGVLKTMLLSKLKIKTAMVLMACMIGVGAGANGFQPAAEEPAKKAKPKVRKAPLAATEAAKEEDAVRGRLPVGVAPTQAIVSLDKSGRLVVRTLDSLYYEPTTTTVKGKQTTSYTLRETYSTRRFHAEDIEAVDMSGKKIDMKDLAKLVKSETLALVTRNPQPIDPLHLRLFKDDTLLFVLPASATPAAVPPGSSIYTPPPIRSAFPSIDSGPGPAYSVVPPTYAVPPPAVRAPSVAVPPPAVTVPPILATPPSVATPAPAVAPRPVPARKTPKKAPPTPESDNE